MCRQQVDCGTKPRIEIGNGFGGFHPCLKDKGGLAELERDPTPRPEQPPEKHRVEAAWAMAKSWSSTNI